MKRERERERENRYDTQERGLRECAPEHMR